MPSDDNLIIISAANMRELIADAIVGSDDMRVFCLPASVLELLRYGNESLRHFGVEAPNMPVETRKSPVVYKPFDRFMNLLPTIRALELEDNLTF